MTGEPRVLGAKGGRHDIPFYLTLAYVAFEYARPQELIAALAVLRLPLLIVLSLATALVFSSRTKLRAPQTQLFLALLVLMGLHVPIAVNNFAALQTTKAMAMTFVGYLAIVTFVDSMPKYRLLVGVWIATILFSAMRAALGVGTGFGAFLEDENDMALAINMMIPFAFFQGLQFRGSRRMYLWFALAGVFVLADAATMSRGGFIGLAVVGLYCWLRAPHKVMSTAAAVGLVLVMVLFAPSQYWEEVSSIADEADKPHGTGQARLYSWKAGWEMFLDHPVLGVGPGNFPWNFEQYEPPEGFAGRKHGGRVAHSLYFTLIPELGLVGVILWSLMLGRTIRSLRQTIRTPRSSARPPVWAADPLQARHLALALEGSMVGYLVSGVFLSVLYYPHLWILTALAVALLRMEQGTADPSRASLGESVGPTADVFGADGQPTGGA